MKTRIQIATENDLKMIKEFDDMCFGSHQGISTEEILNVIRNGAIFLLFNQKDELVGESQLVLNQFDGCQEFPKNTAYAYGTAIHPDHQGNGFGRLLAVEQEKFSLLNNREILHFTVRLENYSSLKMRMDSGAKIVGYDRYYYGQTPLQDSRLILEKNLINNKSTTSDLGAVIVKVNFDNEPEEEKHLEVSLLINQGYIGHTISRSGIEFRI